MVLQRKKRSLCYALAACTAIYVLCHFMYYYDSHKFTALKPLYDAENEAKRLLKFMTSYHYQCNSTVQLGNRSHWPVCVEPDGNLVLDGKELLIIYSVGPSDDLIFERNLVQNFSSRLVIIHHDKHFSGQLSPPNQLDRTRLVTTQLMANDYADFSRNSYGQSTLNALLERFGDKRLDILKLESVAGDVELWEVLHFMIMDHLLQNVKQVYIAVSVDKSEDDYLYSWYRAMYNLFYREGFRLYHTQASDPLCLQVTMMQSCIYYLSWIRNPGLASFVMHPPADFGTVDLERSRLLTYVTHHITPDLCDDVTTVQSENNEISFSYCRQATLPSPCYRVIISSENTDLWRDAVTSEICSLYMYTLHERESDTWDPSHNSFRANIRIPGNNRKQSRDQRSFADIEQRISGLESVSLLVLDLPVRSWVALSYLLDHDSLQNVRQLVLTVTLEEGVSHQLSLRRKFSELQRLEAGGFRLFSGGSGYHPGSRVLSYLKL